MPKRTTSLVLKSYLALRGGPGSGHFGHEGRPGEVGGSQPSDFHSSPGKKEWGRPKDRSDGTTVDENGRRTFIRGWEAERRQAFKETDEALQVIDDKDEDVRFRAIMTSQLLAGRDAIEFYNDAVAEYLDARLGTPLEPLAVDLILPDIVKAVRIHGNSDRRYADIYAEMAANAARFLEETENDPSLLKDERAAVVLASLFPALKLETGKEGVQEGFKPTINVHGTMDAESPFLSSIDESKRVYARALIRAVEYAYDTYRAYDVAQTDGYLDQGIDEADWSRWDSVMQSLDSSEEVRQKALQLEPPPKNPKMREYEKGVGELIERLKEREKLFAAGDPDFHAIASLDVNIEAMTMVLAQKENEGVEEYRNRLVATNVEPFITAFGDDPKPEAVNVELWPETTVNPPPGYRAYEGEEREEAEQKLQLAKASLSTLVSPRLLDAIEDKVYVYQHYPLIVPGGGGMNHFNPKLNIIGSTDGASFGTYGHEMGHALEHAVPGLRKLGWMFYRYRTAHEKPIISRDYAERPDRFLDPYTGRSYNIDGAAYFSEVISNGVGQLMSNPSLFAASDPEYFNFIVTALRGDWMEQENSNG